jgi:hypothetical protein
MATDAAVAYATAADGTWTPVSSSCGTTITNGGEFIIWATAGPAAGHVSVTVDGRCPVTSDPTWN